MMLILELVEAVCDYDENAIAGLRCALYAAGNNGSARLAQWADAVQVLIDAKAGKQPNETVIECNYVPLILEGE